ncbi:MSMEG_1061 family FMN-dependent PPOX-type flavoprotein [Pseudonocardia xinjiangensis]|uniref:MSMEG_1061 family FMN-dependent PPOX-type flavoprotein n=1 Tax=Pseudonocardia xinjiangensis TaxID=75289 RepID=UPI001B7CDBF1|nr:MSMEG_1061 family FMN-dependent PPOX-type flavoprotein [Pseudonocardia xinjiangensis]
MTTPPPSARSSSSTPCTASRSPPRSPWSWTTSRSTTGPTWRPLHSSCWRRRGPRGSTARPRGDPPGFVRVADPKTLLIPDRRGNNRVDSLRNIVRDPRVALVFLIPGIGTLLRVNGRAVLSTDPDPALRESFAMGERRDKLPASVIVVTVDAAYIQCPKALMRSKLWNSATQIPSSAVPSMGEMLEAITNGAVDCQAFDAAAPKRLEETMY